MVGGQFCVVESMALAEAEQEDEHVQNAQLPCSTAVRAFWGIAIHRIELEEETWSGDLELAALKFVEIFFSVFLSVTMDICRRLTMDVFARRI